MSGHEVAALEQAGDYDAFLAEIKERVRGARLRALSAANRELLLGYWSIGDEILPGSQGGRLGEHVGSDALFEQPWSSVLGEAAQPRARPMRSAQ
jgi:hypothetical protein